MKPTLVKPLVAALALGASVSAALAATSYQYRMPVPGLTVNAVPPPAAPALPTVGDGVSKAGACASGAATGCAIWNGADGNLALSGANLVATCTANGWRGQRATISKSSGKWYWEVSFLQLTGSSTALGAQTPDGSVAAGYIMSPGQYLWWPDAYYLANGAFTTASARSAWAVSGRQATIGVMLDMDLKTIIFSQGDNTLASVPVVQSALAPSGWCASSGNTITANFGQATFQYPVPAGYNAGLW